MTALDGMAAAAEVLTKFEPSCPASTLLRSEALARIERIDDMTDADPDDVVRAIIAASDGAFLALFAIDVMRRIEPRLAEVSAAIGWQA